ncbi:acyl-CoA synthetase [Rhodococcus tukisamuensis]|uniref:Fatty-acyl-CoA synthase n=1 Tax=Rhodococcus tukisamuensis TaxID=168276 RepID=A0A1G6XRB1_9NOCA|nr:acyl-CoA synthetase [Rhodococcus tukisamuensis]SDD79907.1 fatty-acyl-CoA synthase [Rhodococcus tukisamuensis]
MPGALKKVTDNLGAARVILRAGLVPIPRADRGIYSILSVDRYGPFAGVVHAHARNGLDAVAVVDERGQLTYAELEELSNALVRAWVADGVTPGSVMGAMCRNHRGLVLAMLAAAKAGTKLVLMNTGFAPPQLMDVAAREQVRAFVYDEEFQEVADALPADVRRYLSWGEDPSGRVRALDELVLDRPTDTVPRPPTHGSFVLLTSGTTGTPKGAPRERTSALSAAQFLDRIPLRNGQTMVMAAPAFHGTGLSQVGVALALGQTVVMQRNFDPEAALSLVAENRADTLVVVPTMLQRIVDLGAETVAKYDTSNLKVIFAAGSALSPDLCTRTTEAFGHVLYNLYGSTEVAVATVATPAELAEAPGTAGRAPVTCHVELYDDAGTRITKPGRIGRIFVSSGLSFNGYTDGHDKERINGLLCTGDVGHFDEHGLLFVDGRDDDMIVSGGENVYPLEVENLLVARPDVLEAAVIGVEDTEFGHRLKAYVVTAAGAPRDEQDLKAYVKTHLARYKVPREVVFLEELPRNATGKLMRRVLIEMDSPYT